MSQVQVIPIHLLWMCLQSQQCPQFYRLHSIETPSGKEILNLSILNFLLSITAYFSEELNLELHDAELHDSLSSLCNFISSCVKCSLAHLSFPTQGSRTHFAQTLLLRIDSIYLQRSTTIGFQITHFVILPLNVFPRTHLTSVSPVSQSCPAFCDPMDYSAPGFSVLHYLLELAQTHVC